MDSFIKTLIGLALLSLSFTIGRCTRQNQIEKPCPQLVHSDTSNNKMVAVNQPGFVTVTKGVAVTPGAGMVKIDTAAIIKQYLTENKYTVDYQNEVIKIKTDFSLFKNEVHTPLVSYELKKPFVTNVYKMPGYKWQFFAGVSGSYGNSFSAFSPQLTVLHKNKTAYTGGYDIINNRVRFGVSFRFLKFGENE